MSSKSKYKNASRNSIRDALLAFAQESYPFQQPILQGDIFWLYCNCRRYWGKYIIALTDAGIAPPDALNIKSELGYKIDWWQFQEGQVQKDCLRMIIDDLFKKGVDVSPKGLKQSNYFDIYTDAVLLFGNYETLLEYAEIKADEVKPHVHRSVDIESIVEPIFDLYLDDCSNHEEKCKKIARAQLNDDSVDIQSITQGFSDCPVIVDGANIARRNNKPLIDNIRLVDKYLQECGFKKENINFMFDAKFRHDVHTNQFDLMIKADNRLSICPPHESADAIILTKAFELLQSQPNHAPFIITNDKYDDIFLMHPEFRPLSSRKRGVTWSYIQKTPEPIIGFWSEPRRLDTLYWERLADSKYSTK